MLSGTLEDVSVKILLPFYYSYHWDFLVSSAKHTITFSISVYTLENRNLTLGMTCVGNYTLLDSVRNNLSLYCGLIRPSLIY